MVMKYFAGLLPNRDEKALLTENYRKLKGARGFISKALALVLTPCVNLLTLVGFIFRSTWRLLCKQAIGAFASNSARNKHGFKGSRLRSLLFFLFSPLIVPIASVVLCFQSLPYTFKGLSAGIDHLFSMMTPGSKSKQQVVDQTADDRNDTTSELYASLGAKPQNAADCAMRTNSIRATTPAAYSDDSSDDEDYDADDVVDSDNAYSYTRRPSA